MATLVVCFGASVAYALLITQHVAARHLDRHALIGYACQALAWLLVGLTVWGELKRKQRWHSRLVRAWGGACCAATVVTAWAALATLREGGGGNVAQLDAAVPWIAAGLGLVAAAGAIDGRASRRRTRSRRGSASTSGASTPGRAMPLYTALLSETSASETEPEADRYASHTSLESLQPSVQGDSPPPRR